ncbi:hypothetical protein [Pseudomonas sp. RIT-PI-AD]|uniref:hypothetical protein n=1 Tax=Pseudomonas sp. RIT-PI-AD TaxID=3035294 RepID=UPI0021D87F97|nr:hypothetical protein [Pseudomonas sp. RIT-PI-AD]
MSAQYGVIAGALLLAGAAVGSLMYFDDDTREPAAIVAATSAAQPPTTAPALPAPSPVASLPAKGAAPAAAAKTELFPHADFREGQADGVPVHYLQAEPAVLADLHEGQVLTVPLPGRAEPLRAELTATHNADGLEVWEARLLDAHPMESMTLVRGRLDTHISVATLGGSLSLIVDNASGQTVITDENELARRSDPNSDHVEFQRQALPPLAPPAQG